MITIDVITIEDNEVLVNYEILNQFDIDRLKVILDDNKDKELLIYEIEYTDQSQDISIKDIQELFDLTDENYNKVLAYKEGVCTSLFPGLKEQLEQYEFIPDITDYSELGYYICESYYDVGNLLPYVDTEQLGRDNSSDYNITSYGALRYR